MLPIYRVVRLGVICSVLIFTSGAGQTNAATTAALVDADKSPLGTLLEAALLTGSKLTWVERNQIDKIVAEQQLQAAFSPEGIAARSNLGRLLKADVLILLRKSARAAPAANAKDARPADGIHLVVCETLSGLRLVSHTLAASPNAQQDAARLQTLVELALRRWQKLQLEICAVPPFISHDLLFHDDYLKQAYAAVVEQTLFDYDGLAVVELAEAKAISKELQLAGGVAKVNRNLPFYLLGEYRQDGVEDRKRVRMVLKLMRGDQQIDVVSQDDLLPAAVPTFLQKTTQTLMAKVIHAPPTKPDPAADARRLEERGTDFMQLGPLDEARQLAERAKEFQRLGNSDEEMTLIEVSLLLRPNQPKVRFDAIVVSGKLWQRFHQSRKDVPAMLAALEHYRRGVEHIEIFARDTVDMSRYQNENGYTFLDSYPFSSIGIHNSLPDEVKTACDDAQREVRQILFRLLRLRIEQKASDEVKFLNYSLRTYSFEERPSTALKIILELQDLPGAADRTHNMAVNAEVWPIIHTNPTAGEEFYKQLASSSNPEIRAGGARAQATRDARRKELAARLASSQPTAKPAPIKEQEIDFKPISFSADGPKGPQPFTQLKGCLSVGEGVEAMWGQGRMFLMKEPGKLKEIWNWLNGDHAGQSRFTHTNTWTLDAVFDGTYLWFVSQTINDKPPQLFVADPVRETVVEVRAADGLPEVPSDQVAKGIGGQRLKLAAVAPGKVCVAGMFGHTWLAMVTFDRAQGAATKVFHECRESPDRRTPGQWTLATVTFQPSYMFTLTDPNSGAKCILILRSNRESEQYHDFPLVVDPDKLAVEVRYVKMPLMSYPEILAMRDGALHFTDGYYYANRVACLSYPSFEVRTVGPDLQRQRGWMFLHRDQVFIVNRGWWWGRLGDSKIRQVADQVPWNYTRQTGPGPVGPNIPFDRSLKELLTVCVSPRYGLLCVVRPRVFGEYELYQVDTSRLTQESPR